LYVFPYLNIVYFLVVLLYYSGKAPSIHARGLRLRQIVACFSKKIIIKEIIMSHIYLPCNEITLAASLHLKAQVCGCLLLENCQNAAAFLIKIYEPNEDLIGIVYFSDNPEFYFDNRHLMVED